ncbi:hypothetical protein DSL72_007038 [Monilinia vaccinii-corymbosi]|uniref:Glycosyltransferase family 25 protein n=1 Tax=Monilinia vaccinii-corymbosi TaxID=61207 RepID=A0A8A3PM29_9HELO|nr:hypothetical protein DSL72_007038 [Monilinia vaccinii-corymbosi]
MITSNSRPYILGACVALTFIVLLSLQTREESSSASSRWLDYSDKTPISHEYRNYVSATSDGRIKPADTTSEIGRASNATLGFEKIFVVGLPERSDRRDAMVLSASLTGFQVEFMDGVRGDQVSDKARPPGLTLKDGAMGSWRGHMNVIRRHANPAIPACRIVENHLASAFIMEDDVDWDIRLLTQLPEYARGIRTLSHVPLDQRQHSPYGDDWDILWPGHCGDAPPASPPHHDQEAKKTKHDAALYIIDNDETVAPKSARAWLKALAAYPENTRVIHRTGAPTCTFGYAVSYRGAQKILMALAVQGGAKRNLALGGALASLCHDGHLDARCYSVEPPLFQPHRPAGAMDAEDGDAKGSGRTDVIVWSARLNLEQMIMGRVDYFVKW